MDIYFFDRHSLFHGLKFYNIQLVNVVICDQNSSVSAFVKFIRLFDERGKHNLRKINDYRSIFNKFLVTFPENPYRYLFISRAPRWLVNFSKCSNFHKSHCPRGKIARHTFSKIFELFQLVIFNF